MIRKPVPGFETRYTIDPKGVVRNSNDYVIKPTRTAKGLAVDLCANGQRALLLVDSILEEVYGSGKRNRT